MQTDQLEQDERRAKWFVLGALALLLLAIVAFAAWSLSGGPIFEEVPT